jgi:hypothetical protein
MAAQMMAAGANQQLIANELQKVQDIPTDTAVSLGQDEPASTEAPKTDDEAGALSIEHNDQPPVPAETTLPPTEVPPPIPINFGATTAATEVTGGFLNNELEKAAMESFEPLLPDETRHDTNQTSAPADLASIPDLLTGMDAPVPQSQPSDTQIHIDEHGNILKPSRPMSPKHKVVEPLTGTPDLPAEAAPDPASLSPTLPTNTEQPLPVLDLPPLPAANPVSQEDAVDLAPDTTLLDIEKSVHSSHLAEPTQQTANDAVVVDEARNAVQQAINQLGYDTNRPEPRTDINAQPLGMPSHNTLPPPEDNTVLPPPPVPPPMMPTP